METTHETKLEKLNKLAEIQKKFNENEYEVSDEIKDDLGFLLSIIKEIQQPKQYDEYAYEMAVKNDTISVMVENFNEVLGSQEIFLTKKSIKSMSHIFDMYDFEQSLKK